MSYNQLLYDKININEKKDELLISLLNDFCNKSNTSDTKMFEYICNQLISLGLISETTFYKLQLVPEIKDNYINVLKSLTNNKNDYEIVNNISDLPYPIQNFHSQYEIKEKIGQGGFGVVYKIFNKLDDNYYALKKIILESNNPDSIKVLREVQALSKLDHINIIRYNTCWLGYDTNDDFIDDNIFDSENSQSENEKELSLYLYIQMELCDNTLENFINERKVINIEDNINIFRQICDGLNYIHQNNFIHRDIKPGNIFFKNKIIKIGDFGLVKKTFNQDNKAIINQKSKHSLDIGTKTYASPEQLNNTFYTHKTDIYSLGIILLELSYSFDTIMEKIDIFNKVRNENIYPKDMPINTTIFLKNLITDDPNIRLELKTILNLDLKKILDIN